MPYVQIEDGLIVGLFENMQSYATEFRPSDDPIVLRFLDNKGSPPRTYRSTFIERMEPNEAETLEAALASADAKLRLMYQSVEYFVADDPLFAVLHWTVAVALGSEPDPNFARADELLAPG